jgi:prepilin-type N-terminal cleavage/methylation domain-containing protein
MQHAPSQRGFTLIELTLVLLIVGLMTGIILQVSPKSSAECYPKTKQQLGAIEAELDRFARANNRLPAPAQLGQGSNNPAFGVEAASGHASVSVGSDVVVVGMVPHTSLGLDSSFASDCWGNRFTYAVTQSLTSSNAASGFPNPTNIGQITITSGPTMIATNIAYTVVSHGEDGFGATPLSSNDISTRNCSGTSETKLDRENCDIAAGSMNATFLVTDFNNGKGAANYFDDLLAYATKPTVTTPMDCAEQSQNWTPGCSAVVPGLMDGNSSTVNNAISGYYGAATFTCTGGLLSISGASCNVAVNCVAGTATWGAGCSASHGAITSGTSLPNMANTAAGYTGQADITCSGAGVVGTTNATCTPMANCNGQTAQWGAGGVCARTLGSLAHGATQTISNSNSGYSGTADVTCNNGSLSYANTICDPVPLDCTGQTVSWGSGCQTNVGPLSNGASDGPYSNTASGYSGTTNVSCSNGTVTPTGSSCNQNCPSGTTSWGTSNVCNGTHAALNHSASTAVSNASAGYTGSVTLSCTNGTLSQSSATCTTCLADGQSSGGDPNVCCNGDSDADGVCGTGGTASCSDECGENRNHGQQWCPAGDPIANPGLMRCSNGTPIYVGEVAGCNHLRTPTVCN